MNLRAKVQGVLNRAALQARIDLCAAKSMLEDETARAGGPGARAAIQSAPGYWVGRVRRLTKQARDLAAIRDAYRESGGRRRASKKRRTR